jgi:multisubunit Na+/H+ antiporter MnhB subunit
MDEHARESFKLRFIKLTLLLNAMILLIAMGAFVLLILHSPPGIALGLGLLVAGALVFLYTWRLYRETKEWLEANAGTGPEKH